MRQAGVAQLVALVAGCEGYGPQLFFSNPSVMFTCNKAIGSGSGSVGGQTNLQESFSEDCTLLEVEALTIQTLKQVQAARTATCWRLRHGGPDARAGHRGEDQQGQCGGGNYYQGYKVYDAAMLQTIIDRL
eukprot:TRINITY_DN2024_c0_g1_i5.p2 TRINITY_DN2024_c0_g1~~TRINITY_DN2024_c0_g1_i5.p2  ORF type:complete len:131 (+),score=33.70 TRINITY_DN2024_c0_g1_i5:266-658(+)